MRSVEENEDRASDSLENPIIFLGPSMKISDAQEILNADFRPPIRRGDLNEIHEGAVVGIIDGVFEQQLAITSTEIRDAILRGVRVVGGGSMGALRAAEVPEMKGLGLIYDWYSSAVIDRDDEVALIFDPRSHVPITVPLVNVRYAVNRLVGLGTINFETGSKIIESAKGISFKDRIYKYIISRANIRDKSDAVALEEMLAEYDLKRNDAQVVLEWLDRRQGEVESADVEAPKVQKTSFLESGQTGSHLLIWECGDFIEPKQLLEFLIASDNVDWLKQQVLANAQLDERFSNKQSQSVLVSIASRWGWISSEEVAVTVSDLLVSKEDLNRVCESQAEYEASLETHLNGLLKSSETSWIAEILVDEVNLKRAAMQYGSIAYFHKVGEDATISGAELLEAKRVWMRVNGVANFELLKTRWSNRGLDEQTQNSLVTWLAKARWAASALAKRMNGEVQSQVEISRSHLTKIGLPSCLKPADQHRFSLNEIEAELICRDVGKTIGITRVGSIGELGEFFPENRIHVVQAARPSGSWSSSYGSGKSRSRAGAVAGSIMEELEKWAQEHFKPGPTIKSSYAALNGKTKCVAPNELDLPYDSVWHPHLTMDWLECEDLLADQKILVPADILLMRRGKNDICYSKRGARKHMATNGLGAGFSKPDACLHALCELVERHSQRIAELFLSNPGGLGVHPYNKVIPVSVGPQIANLVQELSNSVDSVGLMDITSEIGIPTFAAQLVRFTKRAEGFGAHPNPIIAAEMALLEAAQTVSSLTAGAREDLTIHARSLGRHERPRPIDNREMWFWSDPDEVATPLREGIGFVSNDVREDLFWCLDKLKQSGLDQAVCVDMSSAIISPARVVRMIIPGLETNNSLYTGARARLVLGRQYLPRWK